MLILTVSYSLVFNYTTINGTTLPGGYLDYNISLTNNDTSTVDVYLFYSGSGLSTFTPNPPYRVNPGDTKYVGFKVKTPDQLSPGSLKIPLVVSYGNSSETYYLSARIITRTQEVVIKDLIYNPKVSPGTNMTVEVIVSNLYYPKTNDIVLDIRDEQQNVVSTAKKTVTIPTGDKKFTLSVYVPRHVLAGTYFLTATVPTYATSQQDYPVQILPVERVNLTETKQTHWNKLISKVAVTNDGNTLITNYEVSLPITLFNRLFLTSYSPGGVVEGGYVKWQVQSIMPGQTIEFYYTINYTWFYVVIVLLFLFMTYFWFRHIILKVEKEIFDYRIEDNKVTAKMLVRIKNMGNKKLSNIEVLDPLPAFATDVSSFGTVSGKVVSKGKDKFVKWVIDDLSPGEELVLTYRFKTTIGLKGKYHIPPAVVEFVLDRKEYRRRSNAVNILVN